MYNKQKYFNINYKKNNWSQLITTNMFKDFLDPAIV